MTAQPRVALFVDAENAPARHIAAWLDLCRGFGRPTILRCYGTAAALKKWDAAMAAYHIVPRLTPPSAAKANASDLALTIDVVAALHQDLFDHAIIATSDADFTQLAIHIREHGKAVSGLGEDKAPPALRAAFDQFIVAPHRTRTAKDAVAPLTRSTIPAKRAAAPAIDTAWLSKLFEKISKDGATADLQTVARALAAAKPEYKKGYRTLDNFLRKSGLFEIKDKTVHRRKAA